AMRQNGIAPESVRVGVTVLTDPALHGTLRTSDLRGFDPSGRALVAVEHDRSALLFAPRRTADDVLATIRQASETLNPDAATLVVGLAIGGGDWEHCQQFAHGLAEVIRQLPEPPLLLISSDMNHFATDRENRLLDEIALAAMEQLEPAKLLATVSDHNISMCG